MLFILKKEGRKRAPFTLAFPYMASYFLPDLPCGVLGGGALESSSLSRICNGVKHNVYIPPL